MKYQNELHQLVYDYYVTRIVFGYYKFGDTLPSIAKICESFQMSVPTVRTALTRLEKDRYIKTIAPKASKVIYKSSQDDIAKKFSIYFLERKDGGSDIRQVNTLLISPLLEAGIERWDKTSWNNRWQEMKNGELYKRAFAIHIYLHSLLWKMI